MARRTWWKVGALLAAMMVFLTMLPATALAADGDTVYVGGVALTYSESTPVYATTDEDGNVSTTSATADNYNIMWDGSTLTLDGAKIKGGTSSEFLGATAGIYAFNNSGGVSLNIALEGVNEIFESSNGIWVYSPSTTAGNVTLTIEGEGSLNASGASSGIQVQSNSGNAALTIQNADVTAENSSSSGDGVTVRAGSSSSASLSVDGGSLSATGKNENGAGIRYFFGSSSSGCGTPSLTVSGNTIVRANGGISDNSSTDIQIGGDNNSSGGIVFNNGTGTVYGSVTLQEDLTIGEGESLDIPSGASLTIGNDATLTNEGTVTNSGTITNNGTINNSGTLPDIIQGAVPPSITTTSLDGGTVGAAYGATLEANGDPTSWEIAEDTLPTGLTLNKSTGEISGMPTTQGTSNFTVTATNSGGSDSKQLSITISPAALSITTQPSNQSVTEGQTASFSAEATGSGTLTYQWQQSIDGSTWTDISDATGSSYTTQAATMDMNGYQYHCVVTDENNKSVTSQAATLTVTAATVPVTGVTLSQSQAHLYYNGTPNTLALTATVAPDNATDKAVTWTSSNSSVATVDGGGNVTAVAPGTATIAATADGGKTATCLVTVTGVYVPPRPTGPDWGDVADDIADAEPGSTVMADMDGKTMLPGEVLDELAGRDVTLALDMGDGLFWEVYGGDVPADAEYDDVDLGVALGGDSIPADVVNLVTGESGSVQVSLEHDGPFGFELTLVAPLGEDAAGLVANLYRYDDEAGSLAYVSSAEVAEDGAARLETGTGGSWLFALDSRTHALPFSDANDGEWYSEAVRWAWLGDVMTGYGDGSGLFGTSSALTRAEAAVVLWRLAGEPEGAFGLPADCDPSGFYAEAASWALGAGVFSGYSGDAFGPADTITREQLATVLWRAAGSPEVGGDLSSFSDAGDVSGFADVAMRWAVSTGVLRGQGDGDALDPQGACTRAQLATMLYRLAAAE